MSNYFIKTEKDMHDSVLVQIKKIIQLTQEIIGKQEFNTIVTGINQ